MKYREKKNCDNCRALSLNGYKVTCELEYPILALYNTAIPLTGCPKPKGWMRFVHCLQHEMYKGAKYGI